MSKEKEVIKEIHHYHYIPYPSYLPYGWQYPWYPRNPWSPTWVGPTSVGPIVDPIPQVTWTTTSGITTGEGTTTSASTTGKGTTIKYGAYINQLS